MPILLATTWLACASGAPRVEPAALPALPPPEPLPSALESLVGTSPEIPDKSPTPTIEEPPAPPFPDVPFALQGERDRSIAVYPPLSTQGRWPLIVFLHATCMQPAPVCDAFGNAGRDAGWLVCPAGNSACYGEPDWSGPGATKEAFLSRALAQVEKRVAPFLEPRPGVLVGWSRGAYAARDILDAAVTAQPMTTTARRFAGLVLIAASVTLDVAHLRAAGISRIVFAAGDFDGARGTMEKNAATLKKAGLETRYVSLGKIGHAWPNDFEQRMSEPIAWAARVPPALPEKP